MAEIKRFPVNTREHVDVIIVCDGDESEWNVVVSFDDGLGYEPLSVCIAGGTREDCARGVDEAIAALNQARLFLMAGGLAS